MDDKATMTNILDNSTWASRIALYVRQLFGSRLVEHLESQLFHQQSQYEARLNERDQEIARLRQEALRLQAKFDELELDPSYFWFLSQRGKTTPSPRSDSYSLSEVPASAKTWQQIQAEHYASEEASLKETSNAISDSGRDEVVR